jgi:hypothetical protein
MISAKPEEKNEEKLKIEKKSGSKIKGKDEGSMGSINKDSVEEKEQNMDSQSDDDDEDSDSSNIDESNYKAEKKKMKNKKRRENIDQNDIEDGENKQNVNSDGEYNENISGEMEKSQKEERAEDTNVNKNSELHEQFPLPVNMKDIDTSVTSGGTISTVIMPRTGNYMDIDTTVTSGGNISPIIRPKTGNKCPRFKGYFDSYIFYSEKPKIGMFGNLEEPHIGYENIDVFTQKVTYHPPSRKEKKLKKIKKISAKYEKEITEDGVYTKKNIKFISLGKRVNIAK